MGKLVPIQLPPGVFKNGTPYQSKGRWSDCNLIRWKNGRLQPLGGWEKVIGTPITGIGRAMTTWRDSTGARWLAIGTNSKLYIFTSLSGSASDITPSGIIEGDPDGSVGMGFGTENFGGYETIATVTGTDISFTTSGSVITSTSTAFTDSTVSPLGPLPFAVGDEIEISGSVTANNRAYPLSHRVVTVSANQMTVGPKNGSTVYTGTVGGLTITTAGTGFNAGTLSGTGGGGSGFAGTYGVSAEGVINSVAITNAGSGYTSAPTVVISGLTGIAARVSGDVNVYDTSGNAAMWQDIQTPTGFVYTNVAQTSTSGSGSGARFTVDPQGQEEYISQIDITTAGSGYAVNDTIVLTDPGNTTNIVTITVSAITSGVITADNTGTISTASASSSTPITIKRTKRFGNEDGATSSLVLDASSWVFDLWGQNLIGMSTADGKIYEWDPTASNATTTVATVISGAPINNSAVLVSKNRHLFALGAGGNKRKVQWSNAESNTTWGATATNQAGSFEIDTSGEIVAGRTVGDVILIWTSTDLHAITHVGMPYVYGRKKIGDACGAISNRAMIAVGDRAFWMSNGGFFQYHGTVQTLECDVQGHIFKDINRVQDSKIYASLNPEFFEVTWWYASSTSDEILKYVTYNYAEGWWSIGELSRTAFAAGSPGVYENPIGISDDGIVYEHEVGVSTEKRSTSQIAYTNADISNFDRKLVTGTDSTTDAGLCFAETLMEIGDGENVVNVSQLITDTEGVGDNGLRFKFKTRYTPNGVESISEAYNLTPDGYVDVREQGRQFTFRVESGFDQFWELGSTRAVLSQGGKR
jgi:hypothetical protein